MSTGDRWFWFVFELQQYIYIKTTILPRIPISPAFPKFPPVCCRILTSTTLTNKHDKRANKHRRRNFKKAKPTKQQKRTNAVTIFFMFLCDLHFQPQTMKGLTMIEKVWKNLSNNTETKICHKQKHKPFRGDFIAASKRVLRSWGLFSSCARAAEKAASDSACRPKHCRATPCR